jgi:uncharacterized membrane protein YbaN (DUF454 family)
MDIVISVAASFLLFAALSGAAFLYWKSSQKKQDILNGQSRLVELLAEWTKEAKNAQSSHEAVEKALVQMEKVPAIIQALSVQIMIFNSTVKQMVRTITKPDRAENYIQNSEEGDKAAFFEISKIMLEKGISFDQATEEYKSNLSNTTQLNPNLFAAD